MKRYHQPTPMHGVPVRITRAPTDADAKKKPRRLMAPWRLLVVNAKSGPAVRRKLGCRPHTC